MEMNFVAANVSSLKIFRALLTHVGCDNIKFMINPFSEVNWNPDRPARKKFAVSLIIGFPAIAVVFSPSRI